VLRGSLSVGQEGLLPVETLLLVAHESVLALGVDPGEGVHAPPVHLALVPGHAHVVQQPREHVGALRLVRKEVPDAPPLLHTRLRVGLERADHVRESDSVADEEHREIQAYDVVVAFFRLEFQCESTGVA